MLYVPIFNFPRRLEADSIYHISNDWCRAMVEADPDLAIYRFMPAKGTTTYTSFRYTPRKIHPRIHDIQVNMFTWYSMEECHVPFEHVMDHHPILGRRPVDIVVSTSAVKTAYMYSVIRAHSRGRMWPALFNFELLLRSLEGTNEASFVQESEAIFQAVGETMAYNLFESPKCADMAASNARSLLAPRLTARIHANSAMAYSGYPARRGFVGLESEKFKDFTFLTRGRLAASKGIDKILLTLDNLYRSGHPIKALITTGERPSRLNRLYGPIIDKMGNLEVMHCKTADEAGEIMRKCHAFLFWSSHELFAVSVWEMLASGLIGIFKRADWFCDLLPKEYPYVFDTDEEAYVMASHVSKNYAAVKKELAWVPGWVAERYEYGVTTSRTIETLRSKVIEVPYRKWIADALRAHRADTLTYAQCEDIVEAASDMGQAVMARKGGASRPARAVGRAEIREAMFALGFREDLARMDGVFTR